MGSGAEGTSGEVQGALQGHVVRQIRAALLRRGPVGPESAHVLPEDLGCLEGRERPAQGDLAGPVFPLAPLGLSPVAPRIRAQVVGIHIFQYSGAAASSSPKIGAGLAIPRTASACCVPTREATPHPTIRGRSARVSWQRL